MTDNHYQILKVAITASKWQITRAYKTLSLGLHPSRNNNGNASKEFIKITVAYLILSNDNSRLLYDRWLISEINRYKISLNEKIYPAYNPRKEMELEDQRFHYSDFLKLSNYQAKAEKKAEKYSNLSFKEFARVVYRMNEDVNEWRTPLLYILSGVIVAGFIFLLMMGVTSHSILEVCASLGLFFISLVLFRWANLRFYGQSLNLKS